MSFNLPRPDATPFPVDTLAPGTVLVSTTTLPLAGGFFRHTLEALEPLQVPMLITPLLGDQPLIGARLAELGLAYHLPRKKATPEALRAALTALRQDTALHGRVRAMARKLQAVDSPRLAVEALEDLLGARRGLKPAA